MSDEPDDLAPQAPPPSHESRGGAVLAGAVIVVSAVGVLGWHLLNNRKGADLDVSGFDLAAAPDSRRPLSAAPAAAPAPSPAPVGGLAMLKKEEGLALAGALAQAPRASADGSSGGAAAPALSFTQAARKHESRVRAFSIRMTQKHPSIRQYGRDWMSYPDLRKLNDDYMRHKDPVAFMKGLAQSPNFGKLVRKYSTDPGVREFVVDGMKQAPGELLAAAMEYMNDDKNIRGLVTGVVKGMGLPASVTAVFEPKGGQVNQQQIMSDILSDPEAQKAMREQQGGPGVPLDPNAAAPQPGAQQSGRPGSPFAGGGISTSR